jgi:hypothetical protein
VNLGRLLLLGLLLAPGAGEARVARLEIAKQERWYHSAGADYTRIEISVHGELDPGEPIPGLAKAARTRGGRVAYRTKLWLSVPIDPAHDRGTLVVDVINRGHPISYDLYNSGRDSGGHGNAFLQRHGFALAEVAWELGQGADLPSFEDERGTRRYVEGVGLAIVRDVADFLRRARADDTGQVQPLAGRVRFVLGAGYSQTARFLKTLLVEGYNRVDGRVVFDGLHVQAGHAGLVPILTTGTGPVSSVDSFPGFETPDYPGVHVEPLTWGDIVARAEARGEKLPRIAVTNMGQDYLALRTSLSRTGASSTTDVPIPGNVRIWDVAGAPHGLMPTARCERPVGELDFRPVMRAVLLHLDRWVRGEAEPPPSRLMPLEPRPGDAELLQAPAYLPQAVVMAPQRDADGNHLGGVRLPELVAPLAAHGSQNRPLGDRACALAGATTPFARTRAERVAAGDPRPSLEERYANREAWAARVHGAARALVEQGFLLEEDVERIDARASASSAFTP